MGRPKKVNDKLITSLIIRFKAGEKLTSLATDSKLSVRTLAREFRKAGMPPTRGIKKAFPGALSPYHSSDFALWVRTHPGIKLPMSVAGISKMTGVSEKAISSYLERRRKGVEEAIEKLQPSKLGSTLLDGRGRLIPTQAIKSWIYAVNHWSLATTLVCQLKGDAGSATLRIPYSKLQQVIKITDPSSLSSPPPATPKESLESPP